MTPEPLTEIQQKMYQCIIDFIKVNGRPPTVREIGLSIGKESTSHITYHLKEMQRKGWIEREAGKSRAIIPLGRTMMGIPIKGTIAAGIPIDIYEGEPQFLVVDPAFQKEDAFALLVQGDSMIEDHICDGDYVIIRPQTTCSDDDIVVAVNIHAGERGQATLKRFYQEQGRVRLQPANATMEPIYISKRSWNRDWRVQGKVLAVHRVY